MVLTEILIVSQVSMPSARQLEWHASSRTLISTLKHFPHTTIATVFPIETKVLRFLAVPTDCVTGHADASAGEQFATLLEIPITAITLVVFEDLADWH
jgi:hypothetical protein